MRAFCGISRERFSVTAGTLTILLFAEGAGVRLAGNALRVIEAFHLLPVFNEKLLLCTKGYEYPPCLCCRPFLLFILCQGAPPLVWWRNIPFEGNSFLARPACLAGLACK
jgi:hypothetical protein